MHCGHLGTSPESALCDLCPGTVGELFGTGYAFFKKFQMKCKVGL